MVGISEEAADDIRALCSHYESLGRPEAIRNLLGAVEGARARISHSPTAGLTAPRPYPELARDDRRWIKEGRYWLVYSLAEPPVVLAVVFETSDLPGRAR